VAHIVDLRADCATCGGSATHEVFNSRNAPVGRYCWRHAQIRLAEIEREEAVR
jgi:hypothetical protein